MRNKAHNPRSFMNLVRLVGLTALTGVIYMILKLQGKLRL